MEVEYATRKQQLLHECHVAPEIFHQVMPRLATFLAPFVRPFCRQEPAHHAHTYVYGLLADLERKNVESIAYRFGQDRLPLQRFIGWAEWDDAPLRQELTRQVAPAQNVDARQNASGQSRCAERPPRVSFAPPVGVGHAGAQRRGAAAPVDRWR